MNTLTAKKPKLRIATIDVMRAIIMFLMLFVNDIPGVRDLPHWLEHADTTEDMLGFSDIVFPGFLFCVGMSIPFAIRSRYNKGESHASVLWHIVSRSFSLIVMGLFTLNGCKTGLFMLLVVVAFVITWMDYDHCPWIGVWGKRVLKTLGAVLLLCIMLHYDATGQPFATRWWGILGLIGWAYLVSALLYVVTQKNMKWTIVAWLGVIALCIINSRGDLSEPIGFIPEEYFSRNIFLPFWPGGWTHPALVMSGMVASLLLTTLAKKGATSHIFATFGALSIVSFALTLVAHHFWIISKDIATPTWLFVCLGIFFLMVPCIYWITDLKGRTRWFDIIAPAGTATLTCYMLPYFWWAA